MNKGPRNLDLRRATFESIYGQHGREVWAVAYARWLNADLAMDLAQEAFLRLWRQMETGERILNPRAWLLRVTRNLAEDVGKSSFHRNGTSPTKELGRIPSKSQPPVEELLRREAFACVRSELAGLSENDRELLTFRYALDYSIAQIADALDVNAAAVHMRLGRARQRLADRLLARGLGTET